MLVIKCMLQRVHKGLKAIKCLYAVIIMLIKIRDPKHTELLAVENCLLLVEALSIYSSVVI